MVSRIILSDREWIEEWHRAGRLPATMSRNTGIALRNVNQRRKNMIARGVDPDMLQTQDPRAVATAWAYPRMQRHNFDDGVMIVYADAHYWPGAPPTAAFKALLALCVELKPKAVVANGDIIDGSSIKRFPNQGWEKLPKVDEEIAEAQARQAEIRRAAGEAKLFRTIGNHDLRFDRFLSAQAESFEGLKGFRLSDHLPDWPGSWNLQINDTIIKHRNRGGIHAARNNVIQAGVNMVTAHLHTIGAPMIRGYRNRPIWGVQIPTLSEPSWDGPDEGGGPFEYTEDNPTDWVSGFGVLTYHRGALVPPEFCQVVEGQAWFRGRVVE